MTEATLKTALTSLLRKELTGAVIFSHTGAMTSGIPDISVTWRGKTSWFEVKWANPTIKSRGDQDLSLLRLAGQGNAWYIIYEEKRGVKRTGIVHPSAFQEGLDGEWCSNYNHRWVADFIQRVHK